MIDSAEPAAAPAEDAIRCEGLRLTRGRWHTVLDGISLQIPVGAVVGLVGRNGAGKTSLIQCLVGLTLPDSGRCELLGEPAHALTDAVRDRLGFVAQQPDLFGWLSGTEHLQRFSTVYSGWDERRALELSVRLDLNLATPARRLSGGDQQKLSVVLALAHDPDLLILDEPVASLDPLSRRDFMRSLFERSDPRQAARTVLISSHLLSDLERVVTHVAFLREGRLQLFGEWDALAEHLRLLALPAHSTALPQRVLQRRSVGDRVRVLFDSREAGAPPAAGRALNLDELFDELNQPR
ncbi:MAG: ABC transporter ATP-binding protein [Rubrivivax sp.]|nr:ABC transporter ATP-binding protein [Rubrivivax sp.]